MSTSRLLHWQRDDGKTACGRDVRSSMIIRVSADPGKVTCRQCRRSLENLVKPP